MQVAQKLYEGKELGTFGFAGLITYMRTDSVRISDDALAEVRAYIAAKYGDDILPEKPNFYQCQKSCTSSGRARGHPPDVDGARSGEDQGLPDPRGVRPLQDDLGPLRRLADEARALRRHRRRHHRRQPHAPRLGRSAEVRRLPGRLPGRAGRRRRRRRREEEREGAAAAERRRRARSSSSSTRSRTSPSRRRASRKRRS